LGRSAALVAAVLVLSACATGPTITTGTDALPGASTVTATPPAPVPGSGNCSDLSRATRIKRGLEVQGVVQGGDPFYVLFSGARSLTHGRALTAYLRLPGARSVRITLMGPQDKIARATGVHPGLPSFPWVHPGDPWTGIITFPQPGCWRVHVQRSALDGDMWVRVG
jgi:hypothetical protein